MKSIKRLSLRLFGAIICGILIIGASLPAFAAGDIKISVKAVDSNQNPVAGALFELIGTGDSEGLKLSSTLSGQDGISVFSNVPENAAFKIFQKSAPEKYIFLQNNEKDFKTVNSVVKRVFYEGVESDYDNSEPEKWENSDYEALNYTIPVVIEVKQTGEKAPGKQTFKLKFNDQNVVEENFVRIITDTVETDGVGVFTGEFKFTVPDSYFSLLSDGIFISQENGNADGWTYSDSVYYVLLHVENKTMSSDTSHLVSADTSVEIRPVIEKTVNDGGEKVLEIGDKVNEARFINSYNKAKELTPSEAKPDSKGNDQKKSPQTGEVGQICHIALFVGICVLGIFAVLKRKTV